jgi:hypothetical protein
MPDKIYVFKDIDDAVFKLKKYNSHFILPVKDYDKKEIIINSATGSIFRALSGNSFKPSSIYRTWADGKFNSIIYSLGKINTQNEYDNIIYFLNNSLIKFWRKKSDGKNISYGPASKLVNLLIKLIQETKKYSLKKIFKFQHIPFDSFTLRPLGLIINDLTSVAFNINIPKGASMNYIMFPEQYKILQIAISNLSKKAKINPIIYEYWCWNDKH